MIKVNSVVTFILVLLVNIIIIFSVNERAIYVLIPVLLTTNIFLLFSIILQHKIGSFPFFDVGFFCVFTTFVYTVYPLLNYLADGLQFGLFADSRLSVRDISPQELGRFHYRHVLYIFCLAISYLLVRSSKSITPGKITRPRVFTLWSVGFFFIILIFYFFLLEKCIWLEF